jgi:hypothetical protein
MTTNGYEPAFPVNEIEPEKGHYNGFYEIKHSHYGMSLLDYFASAVMQGLCANNAVLEQIGKVVPESMPECLDVRLQVLAKVCYRHADAMLAERERRSKETT